MIAVNTTLTKIELQAFDWYFNWQERREPEYYAMYFHALRQNQMLTDVQVELGRDRAIGKDYVAAIGSYLESSTVLRKFSLRGGFSIDSNSLQELEIESAPSEYLELFVEELAHSCNIVKASFGEFQSDSMDYHLAFNRYGRKHLLDQSFPTELLPVVFARQGDDHAASCIYTCLRESPNFVST